MTITNYSLFQFYLILLIALLCCSCGPHREQSALAAHNFATQNYAGLALPPSGNRQVAQAHLYEIESESLSFNGGEKRFRNIIKVNDWSRVLKGGREKIPQRKLFLAGMMHDSAVQQCYPKRISNPSAIDFGMGTSDNLTGGSYIARQYSYSEPAMAPYSAEVFFNCN